MKEIKRKKYNKPEIFKIVIDNKTSIHMLSENGIPDGPPWDEGSIQNKKAEPYKIHKA